jgi:hypothetical protein
MAEFGSIPVGVCVRVRMRVCVRRVSVCVCACARTCACAGTVLYTIYACGAGNGDAELTPTDGGVDKVGSRPCRAGRNSARCWPMHSACACMAGVREAAQTWRLRHDFQVHYFQVATPPPRDDSRAHSRSLARSLTHSQTRTRTHARAPADK